MDKVLFFLLKKGGNRKSLRITTAELGRALGMSQQNASRRLGLLLASGLVEKNDGIRITPLGMKKIEEHYTSLKRALEGKGLAFSGEIVDGVGKGKYYLSLSGYKNEIKDKLGFTPYAGTLNIRLGRKELVKRGRILGEEPVVINGFRTRERTFGDLFAYPCRVDDVDAALVFPLRSNHPPDIIEIIAGMSLRKVLDKGTGKRVRVKL